MQVQYDESNIFARILRKEIPAHVIFETEASIAILDAFPCTDGHALLIPKHKAATLDCIDELDNTLAAQVLKDLGRLVKVVKASMRATAVNVVNNNFPDSGQIVNHIHFHVIPRTTGDHLVQLPRSAPNMISTDAAQDVLNKMRTYL